MQGVIRYKVTVTAVVERMETVGKEWATVDHVLIDGTDKLKPVSGYTPEIEKTVRKDLQIYDQVVDQLDMGKLVSVGNGLK